MKEIFENLSMGLGVFLTVISFAVIPYLPKDSPIPPILKGVSAALFLAGFGFKINRIDKSLSYLNQERKFSNNLEKRSIEKILPKINRQALSRKPLYLQTTSKVFGDYVWNNTFSNGIGIINHLENEENSVIVIDNITPAYELMREIIGDLDENYAYVATSKLASYDLIANRNFESFSNILEDKAKDEKIFACRLYYLDNSLTEENIREITNAQNNKIIVKYIENQTNIFSFSDSRDLALLMSPPKTGRLDIPTLKRELNTQEPINYLESKGYQKICAIEFHLNEHQINNSISLREVSKMEIVSPRHWRLFNNYENEFKKNWKKSHFLSD